MDLLLAVAGFHLPLPNKALCKHSPKYILIRCEYLLLVFWETRGLQWLTAMESVASHRRWSKPMPQENLFNGVVVLSHQQFF